LPSAPSQCGLDHFGRIWGVLDYEFIRVAVKPEHVQEYDLPENPDPETANRLRNNDPRYRSFMRKYGKLYAVELDALAGKEPDAFRELVQAAVDEHFDYAKWEEIQRQYDPKKVKKVMKKEFIEEILPLLEGSSGKKKENKRKKK
jgi:hypothetical protein